MQFADLFGFNPVFDDDDAAGSGTGGDADTTTADTGTDDDDTSTDDDKDNDKKDSSDAEKTREKELADENNRLKREAATRAKKDRTTANAQAKTEKELRERLEVETKRADDAESQLSQRDQETLVVSAAREAGMEFPEDAVGYLTADEMKDSHSVEVGLRRVKEKRPKLFVEVRNSGGDIIDPTNNENQQPPITRPGDANAPVMGGINRLRSVKHKT